MTTLETPTTTTPPPSPTRQQVLQIGALTRVTLEEAIGGKIYNVLVPEMSENVFNPHTKRPATLFDVYERGLKVLTYLTYMAKAIIAFQNRLDEDPESMSDNIATLLSNFAKAFTEGMVKYHVKLDANMAYILTNAALPPKDDWVITPSSLMYADLEKLAELADIRGNFKVGTLSTPVSGVRAKTDW